MPSWIIPLLPLVGVVVGYVLNFFTNSHANKQQLKRDQIAYKHSVQDVRRERLRSAYKVILNAAEEYQSVLLELQVVYAGETEDTRNKRLSTSLNQSLSGMNEAMIEITLDDVGADAKRIFNELRGAYIGYTTKADTNKQAHGTFPMAELTKDKDTVREKVVELTGCMQRHLKELES